MRNRLNRMGASLFYAMCLLSTCGITSCHDDYDLDETKPPFLGESIYDELKKNGTFSTEIRLIDDLQYADVLAKTGSKTLFVANDEAFAHFFQTTDWKDGSGQPVRSYEQLSTAQKRLLLNGSMLNNAYVLEMLANTAGGSGKNLCLRQGTNATATDSITFWRANQLPVNLYEAEEGETTDPDQDVNLRDLWSTYRRQDLGRLGIYMAVDKTNPMMTHFLEGQMKEKRIKHSDAAFILNLPDGSWAEDENRSYVYNRQIIEPDVTCLNGYYHVIDSVLVTPPSMAEVIRTNGSTSLFSQMLDRFSVPFYDAELTALHYSLTGIADSVFQKRYVASNTQTGELNVDMRGRSLGFPLLNFDPAWNEYAVSSSIAKENDMAAIFVPSDEAMRKYFIEGAGKVLMERYAKKANTAENLSYNLYQIPLSVVSALLNNLMKESFSETVPSKYFTIMNDAQDQMFPVETYETEEAYRRLFEKRILANNGVIYVMNTVIAPADYSAVCAPALYSSNTRIFNAVLRADENNIETNYDGAPLKQYFSTYLKAMQSRFSFFVPTDEGLGLYGYIDPASLQAGVPTRYWRYTYSPSRVTGGQRLPIEARGYAYDKTTGQTAEDGLATNRPVSLSDQLLTTDFGQSKRALLIEMVNNHMVVHDNNDASGVNSTRKYFTARSGAPVYVQSKGNAAQNGLGMQVLGGYQVELNADDNPANDNVSTVVDVYDMTRESNGYGNGMTYFLDRPMQASMNSVYKILVNNENFARFFSLCNPTSFSEKLLQEAGFEDSIPRANHNTLWKAEQNKYRVFTNEDGFIPATGEYLVRFFNNYRYTVYIPTNAAVDAAIAAGLPTWESIEEYIKSIRGENFDQRELTADEKAKAQAMIICLANFVRYHFQDDAYYLDNVTESGKVKCQTACIEHNAETDMDAYLYVNVDQTRPNALTVEDNNGGKIHVIAPYNLMARDMNFKNDPSNVVLANYVNNSSYAAVHQVDAVLNFKALQGGRYDSDWATANAARRFAAKYRLRY